MLAQEYLDDIFVIESHLSSCPDFVQVVPLGSGSIIPSLRFLISISKLNIVSNGDNVFAGISLGIACDRDEFD